MDDYDAPDDELAMERFNEGYCDGQTGRSKRSRQTDYVIGYEAAQKDARDTRRFRQSQSDDDREWRREQAMEAGMGLGIDAYNEIMGND